MSEGIEIRASQLTALEARIDRLENISSEVKELVRAARLVWAADPDETYSISDGLMKALVRLHDSLEPFQGISDD